MKRPAFQFYPGDWRNNAKLRRCTFAERGVWLEVMCLMHDSDEYGVLRWPLKEIAQAVGCKLHDLQSLVARQVLKGCDTGQRCETYMFTPTHAGKSGNPVALIEAADGPVWFSSRMVTDEHLRKVRGKGTRFESEQSPKGGVGDEPKPPIGEPPNPGFGDGATSSSSSSSNYLPTATAVGVADATPGKAIPDCPHSKIVELYHELLPACPRVAEWNETRQGYLRARWRAKSKPNGVTAGYSTVEAGLAWWRKFLGYCGESTFLTGQTEGRDGKPPFVADLEWIVKPSNFAKIIEGKYHR